MDLGWSCEYARGRFVQSSLGGPAWGRHVFTRTLQTPGQVRGDERYVLPSAPPIIFQLSPDGQTVDENDLAHERWCNHLAAKLLCVSVLDRFGDFVSDQVMQILRNFISR
jgi:hypothetical protein